MPEAPLDASFGRRSIVEAYWRSLKHQWLFLNSLDSVARVRTLVEFHVNEHNTKMPHPAFDGQTLAWPPIARCRANAVLGSKRQSQFLFDFTR